MAETYAIDLDMLVRASMGDPLDAQPLCPACRDGRLHPYRVTIPLGFPGFQGVQALTGWVARCVGNGDYVRAMQKMREKYPDVWVPEEVESCGFVMPMTPNATRG